MDWNNTKSIFIMVFCVLNIFLLYQLLEKINDNQYDEFINTESSYEEVLKEDEITIKNPLAKQKVKDQFLIAKSKSFDKKELKDQKNQKVDIIEGNKLVGSFKEPITLGKGMKPADIELFLKDHIAYGNEYGYWSYDEEEQVITCYQVTDNKMLFNNSKGKVTLYLNNEDEVTSYEQTYLVGIKKFNKPKELYTDLDAVYALYSNGNIVSKDEVTDVQLGFYNSLQTTSSSHLLVPTWWVVVNGEKDLFVNAFDGEVIELNTEEKILE